MADFIALYKSKSISEAEPCLVHQFFTELVGKQEPEQDPEIAEHAAPVLEVVDED